MQGAPLQLAAALPSLTELDLSDNLVADWAFAEGLLRTLPGLGVLTLSRNRLALPAALPTPDAPLLASRLHTLVLADCPGLSWCGALAAAAALPSLRRLVLCRNGIASLAPRAPGRGGSSGGGGEGGTAQQQQLAAALGSLEALDLEGNRLSDWGEVALLAALPRLRSLHLGGNQLREIQYSSGFPALTSLLLVRGRSGNRSIWQPKSGVVLSLPRLLLPAAGATSPEPAAPCSLYTAPTGRQRHRILGPGGPAGPLPRPAGRRAPVRHAARGAQPLGCALRSHRAAGLHPGAERQRSQSGRALGRGAQLPARRHRRAGRRGGRRRGAEPGAGGAPPFRRAGGQVRAAGAGSGAAGRRQRAGAVHCGDDPGLRRQGAAKKAARWTVLHCGRCREWLTSLLQLRCCAAGLLNHAHPCPPPFSSQSVADGWPPEVGAGEAVPRECGGAGAAARAAGLQRRPGVRLRPRSRSRCARSGSVQS